MKTISLALLLLITQVSIAEESTRGILVWFYSLDIKKNRDSAVVTHFKQTAGANTLVQEIHNILPLSPQSKITYDNDGNWYLNLAPKKVFVKKKRPLFLGQILDLTKTDTFEKVLPGKDNIPVSSLKFSALHQPYLADRKDLKIHDLLGCLGNSMGIYESL